ncbi:N-acetyltransferase [Erysipelotrichaceae bacterium RD49]|nr:N-acetyltransferase [Erysipelotrichaceae bacterium RD49]
MNTDVRIRFLRLADLPAVYEIICFYIQNSTANLSWTNPDYDEFADQQQEIAAKYPYLVAEYEGKVIGFGYAHTFLGKEAYQFDAELTIYFQEGDHHGLAGKLYEGLEEICKAMGIVRLISCTTASNQASLHYQIKQGFRPYGLLAKAGYKNGKWYDVTWMEKQIASFEHPERLSLEDVRQEFCSFDLS